MAKAMTIVLTGTAINVGNQLVQGEGFNFRMGAAGVMAGFFLSGIEKLNETAGTGLAIIFFITVMFTPFKGDSPMQTLANATKPGSQGPLIGPRLPPMPLPTPSPIPGPHPIST